MRIIYFVGFCLLFLGCSSKIKTDATYTVSKVNKQDLELVHLRSFTLNSSGDSVVIANPISKFNVSKDGQRFAFYDFIYKSILVTDSKGNILHTAGGAGKGPGEFVQILSWTFDEQNNLIVYDEGQRLIKVFNAEGNLKKAVKILEEGNFFASGRYLFSRDSLFFIPGIEAEFILNKPWNSKLMAVLNSKGETKNIVGHYDPYLKEVKTYLNDPLMDIDFDNNKIYSTQLSSYRIQIWDMQNFKRTDYFGYRSKHFKETEEEIKAFYPRSKIYKMSVNQSSTQGIFVTSNYLLLYFQNLSDEWFNGRDPADKTYFITIYDRKSHAFVKELKVPYPIGAVADNKIYVIENDQPKNYTIGVYEIQNDT